MISTKPLKLSFIYSIPSLVTLFFFFAFFLTPHSCSMILLTLCCAVPMPWLHLEFLICFFGGQGLTFSNSALQSFLSLFSDHLALRDLEDYNAESKLIIQEQFKLLNSLSISPLYIDFLLLYYLLRHLDDCHLKLSSQNCCCLWFVMFLRLNSYISIPLFLFLFFCFCLVFNHILRALEFDIQTRKISDS